MVTAKASSLFFQLVIQGKLMGYKFDVRPLAGRIPLWLPNSGLTAIAGAFVEQGKGKR